MATSSEKAIRIYTFFAKVRPFHHPISFAVLVLRYYEIDLSEINLGQSISC